MRLAVLAFVVGCLYWAAPQLCRADSLDQGVSEAATGDFEAALESVEAFLASQPGDRRGAFLRGYLLGQLGRGEEARAQLAGLVASEGSPGLPEAYNNLALLLVAEGGYEEAAEVLKAGLRSRPAFRVLFDNLNLVLGELAGRAYSEALGEDWVDSEPPRLAWIEDVVSVQPLPQDELAPVVAPVLQPDSSPATAPAGEPSEPNAIAQAQQQTAVEQASGAAAADDWFRVVESWARAWSAQDGDGYLGHYAASFVPPDGLTRTEWEALRRARLAAPRFIEVGVAFDEATLLDSGAAEVRFIQSYRSDVFSDTVTKTLRLIYEDGWKIAREAVD